MRLIISGGGTGGHIYPALAIANGIKEAVPSAEILYVGTDTGMESRIVPQAGYQFKSVDISGIDRSSMLKASKSLVRFPRSLFQAWDIIKEFKPDVVLGTGGYVSFPVVLAGTFFQCKTIIHEQNAMPGLANRNLAKRVNYTLLTFPEAKKYLRARQIIVTGLPVRKEILEIDRVTARKELNLEDKFTLVVFGGSRGAQRINKAVLEMIPRYADESELQIIWITGENNYADILDKLHYQVDLKRLKVKLLLKPYMYDIEKALAVADLAVCRAGASTVSELSILGLPAILIPYPFASENHQEKNARALMGKKAVEMVIDEFLDGDTLYKEIEKLRQEPRRLKEMATNIKNEARPHALQDIIKIVIGE